MPRSFKQIPGLASILLLGLASFAAYCRADEPKADAQPTVDLKVESIGLQMKHPKNWVPQLIQPKAAAKPAERISGVRFAIDKASSVLALMRTEIELPAGTDPAAFLKKSVETASEARKGKENVKVLEDRAITIAGGPGWLTEINVTSGNMETRVCTMKFIHDGREYSIAFAGQRDFYSDAREAVGKWAESLQWIK